MILFFTACKEENASDFLFTNLSPSQTNITFQNTLQETEKFNIIQYLYYYNGGGIAVGDINNDGLPDLYFSGNQSSNKLYLNQGNFTFKDITDEAEVSGNYGENSWTTGVSMIDVNRDGWLDIYVCEVGDYKHIKGRNRLYLNDGATEPHFTESAEKYGLDFIGFGQQAAWLDYDLDGDTDVYLLNHSVHSAENYAKSSVRNQRDSLSGDRLLRNDGNHFTDVSAAAGIYGSKIGFGLGVTVSDINDDGYPDIYVANDFHENDYLYYNLGDGTFREGIRQSLGHSGTFAMGVDAADLNNDGLPEIMTLDMKPEQENILKSSVGADPYNIYNYKIKYGYHYQYPRNMLQLNRGKLRGDGSTQFSEIGQFSGVSATDWSWGTLLADFDQDGNKDIFVSNGIWRRPNDLDYLKFMSNQQIQESASDLELAQQMPSGQIENYAYRGAPDLRFENVSKKWGLDLKGSTNGTAYADLDQDGDLDLILNNLNAPATIYRNNTRENKAANFIKIVVPQDRMLGAKVTIKTASGTQMQEIYSVRGWQSGSTTECIFGIGNDSIVSEIILKTGRFGSFIKRDIAANKTVSLGKREEVYSAKISSDKPVFQREEFSIFPYTHRQNEAGDFNREKLLLRKLSAAGPDLRLADFNQDGLEDLRLENKEVWLQTVKEAFQKDENIEIPALGIESFITPQTSCVVTEDFNNDGFTDYFIGTRYLPNNYGISPTSYLFLSDKKGNLTKKPLPNDGKIGMVTAATIIPETKELVVVGEYMPVRIFDISESEIKEKTIEKYGWWNTVTTIDSDGDGKSELLLGNEGLNSDLRASDSEPVELWVADFDKNGTSDPITSYFKQGKKYTYAGKDELAQQLVSLKKKYNDYARFSESDFTEVFADYDLDKIKSLNANTFASMWCDLDGNCRDLPAEIQYAPLQSFAVDDFNGDGFMDILTVGNFYENVPALGRSDASFGHLLLGNGTGNFSVMPASESGFSVFGDARKVRILQKNAGKKRVLVLKNNGTAEIFKY